MQQHFCHKLSWLRYVEGIASDISVDFGTQYTYHIFTHMQFCTLDVYFEYDCNNSIAAATY